MKCIKNSLNIGIAKRIFKLLRPKIPQAKKGSFHQVNTLWFVGMHRGLA